MDCDVDFALTTYLLLSLTEGFFSDAEEIICVGSNNIELVSRKTLSGCLAWPGLAWLGSVPFPLSKCAEAH